MHYAECSSHDEDFLERRTATTWPFLQLIDQQLLGNGKNGENKDKDCSNSSDRYSIDRVVMVTTIKLLTVDITNNLFLPVIARVAAPQLSYDGNGHSSDNPLNKDKNCEKR